MPLAILTPAVCRGLRRDWHFAPFASPRPVRQPDEDVDILAATSIRSDFHAHRSLLSDDARFWSSQSSSSRA